MRRNNNYGHLGAKRFFALAAGIFLLSACGNAGEDNPAGASAPTESDVIESDFEYPFVAESENGFYFWEHRSEERYVPRLMFLDKESGKVVPLCNKPDCMHEGKECNACFPDLDFGEDGIDKHYLQYYEGSLYAVGVSSDNYVSLFRIEPDGSEWEISTKLYRADYAATGQWRTLDIWINDGYVYFSDAKQKKAKLERMPIGGRSGEVLFEGNSDAVEVQIFRIECSPKEQCVFFQARIFEDKSIEHSVGGLYQYDISTGECGLVKIDLSGPYTVRNGKVYYGSMEGLCCYSIQDRTVEVLSDQPVEVPNITLTRDYIILCDQMEGGNLIIYDYEGTQAAKVSGELRPTWYFGGNSEMLFAECVYDNKTRLCYLDLTRPLDELQWEELKAE